MAFNQTPTILQSPTTDRDAVERRARELKSSGGTATGDAVARGAARAQRRARRAGGRRPRAIVLLSDGESTSGVDPLAAARRRAAGDPDLHRRARHGDGTITVPAPGGGTETRQVPPDPGDAAPDGRGVRRPGLPGRRREAAPGLQAPGLAARHARTSSARSRPRSPAAALALLLAGARLSLRWFGRLI